jgi:hypothetical protein
MGVACSLHASSSGNWRPDDEVTRHASDKG